MRFLLPLLPLLLLLFTSCANDAIEEQEHDGPIRRTIIAYIIGDNNLSSNLQTDISEMVEGSKKLPADCRLVAFVDTYSNPRTKDSGRPYIAEIRNGHMTKLRNYDKDFFATSPDSMLSIMQWIISQRPADEYALVMSGHGTGPIISPDTLKSFKIQLNAYGVDDVGDATVRETWINIPSLATVFSRLHTPEGNAVKFRYIFFDCCCMQNVEVAYQLRHATDYIIAPASETPEQGAPYQTIVPVLATEGEAVCSEIINHYIRDTNWDGYGGIAITGIRTAQLHDLMIATRRALRSIPHDDGRLILYRKGCIYYCRNEETDKTPVLHDIRNLMLLNLSQEEYAAWLPHFRSVIAASYTPLSNDHRNWYSSIGVNCDVFTVNSDTYGGVSMIAPYDDYDNCENISPYNYTSLNKTMFSLLWAHDVGWHELGW